MIRLAAEYKYSFDMLLSASAMADAKVRRQRLGRSNRLPANFNEASTLGQLAIGLVGCRLSAKIEFRVY
jgi:hypothetical protein